MELSTLEWLKLNNNELRSLPYTLMEPVLMSLKYIDVYSEWHGITIYMLDVRYINSKHVLQRTRWCATVRCAGTASGTSQSTTRTT